MNKCIKENIIEKNKTSKRINKVFDNYELNDHNNDKNIKLNDKINTKKFTHQSTNIREKIEFGSMPSFNKVIEDDSDSSSYTSEIYDNDDKVQANKNNNDVANNLIENMNKLTINKGSSQTYKSNIHKYEIEKDHDFESQILNSFEEDQEIDKNDLRREICKILQDYDTNILTKCNKNKLNEIVTDFCFMLKHKFGNVNHKKHIIESIIIKHIKSSVIKNSIFTA